VVQSHDELSRFSGTRASPRMSCSHEGGRTPCATASSGVAAVRGGFRGRRATARLALTRSHRGRRAVAGSGAPAGHRNHGGSSDNRQAGESVGARRRRLPLLPRLGGAGQGRRRAGFGAPGVAAPAPAVALRFGPCPDQQRPRRAGRRQVRVSAACRRRIRENPIAGVVADGDRLAAVRFVGGETRPREALFVVTVRRQPSDLAARLGCPVFSMAR
jgi:hypothetical protein